MESLFVLVSLRHGARSVEFAPSRSNQGRFVFYNDLKVRNLMHHHDDLLVDSSMIVPLLDLGCILLGTIPERDCTEEKQDAFFFWVTFQSRNERNTFFFCDLAHLRALVCFYASSGSFGNECDSLLRTLAFQNDSSSTNESSVESSIVPNYLCHLGFLQMSGITAENE